MKKIAIAFMILVVAGISIPAVDAQERGRPLSVELIAEVSIPEVLAIADGFVPPEIPPILVQFLLGARYSVRAYRVVYETIDGSGVPTLASTLVAVPVGLRGRAPMMVYEHGTLSEDSEVPSAGGREAPLGYAFASAGYVAVLPDYLGFGASTIVNHPYIHAKTEATATVDALRAVKTLVEASGMPLNGQLFISGYSQGGHAAVATMREIEQFHRDEFNLVLTSAGSGPYNVAGVQASYALDNGAYDSPDYMPFIVLGYQGVYGNLYNDVSEILVPPYDTLLPPLFDRMTPLSAVAAQIPDDWRDILQPEFLSALRTNPFHPVNRALADNDLLNFRPTTPLIMFYGTEDEQVTFRNAQIAQFYYKVLRQSSVQIDAVSVGPLTHGGVVPFYILLTKLNFDFRRTP